VGYSGYDDPNDVEPFSPQSSCISINLVGVKVALDVWAGLICTYTDTYSGMIDTYMDT
jgi:hypothetical protein